MKRKPLALLLLVAATLTVGLTGCGDEGVKVLKDKVTAGKDAGTAVEGLDERNQQQSDEVTKYLE